VDGENGDNISTELAIYAFALLSDAGNGFTIEGLRREALRLLEAIEVFTWKKRPQLLFIGYVLGGVLIKEVSEPRFGPLTDEKTHSNMVDHWLNAGLNSGCDGAFSISAYLLVDICACLCWMSARQNIFRRAKARS
jgi:hypothetical protein